MPTLSQASDTAAATAWMQRCERLRWLIRNELRDKPPPDRVRHVLAAVAGVALRAGCDRGPLENLAGRIGDDLSLVPEARSVVGGTVELVCDAHENEQPVTGWPTLKKLLSEPCFAFVQDAVRAPASTDGDPPARSLADIAPDAARRIQRRAEGQEKPIGLPWPNVAAQLGGGLWPGVHVLVGGTGVGKTQLGLQVALHAVDVERVPVLYLGLELDEVQVWARLAALRTGAKWSDLYLGRIRGEALADLYKRVSGPGDALLSFEEGPPNGWPFERLFTAAARVREAHPEDVDDRGERVRGSKPFLVVLDFLQLVGDDPAARGEQRALDLRERIGRAAYVGRRVARELDAAVLLISSAARTQYGLLAGDVKDAGLAVETERGEHGNEQRRVIRRPDVLVGVGKESGEIEYAADSVSVAVRVSNVRDTNGHAPLVLATPKIRAGWPSWSLLSFDGARLAECGDAEAARVVEGLAKSDDVAPAKRPKRAANSETDGEETWRSGLFKAGT